MKRFAILLTGYVAVAAVTMPAFVRPVPRLVWNASASVPLGLYSARPSRIVRRGDLVAARPPEPLSVLMAQRGYLPRRVPMLKHVAALAGQTICRTGTHITIDGKRVAQARTHDRLGRALRRWNGCLTLRRGEVLLLNGASADSFDGRYFGATSTRAIDAVLTPLWVSAAPSAARERPAHASPTPSQPKTKGA